MLTGVNEMQYRPDHMMNPGTDASYRLANYVTQNGAAVTVDKRGRGVTDREVNGFRSYVANAGSSAMHTFSFDHDIPTEDLIEGIREPAREHLDGQYLIGVHEDTDHNHIHIGEAGSMDELNMPAGKVRQFATDVASNLGVSYG